MWSRSGDANPEASSSRRAGCRLRAYCVAMGALQWQSLAGVAVCVLAAWLLSERRRVVPWRTVAAATGLTFVLAALLLHAPGVRAVFALANDAVAPSSWGWSRRRWWSRRTCARCRAASSSS